MGMSNCNLIHHRKWDFGIQVRAPRSVVQVALPRSATGSNDAPAERPKEVIGTINSLVPKIVKKGALGQLEQTGPNQNLRLLGTKRLHQHSEVVDIEKF